MKTQLIISFFTLALFASCQSNKKAANYLVTTQVEIIEGKVNEVLALFQDTNPALVKNEKDWIKAVFSVNEAENLVQVEAYWHKKESYLTFSQSKAFKATMSQFGKYFKGKPEVQINKILFQM